MNSSRARVSLLGPTKDGLSLSRARKESGGDASSDGHSVSNVSEDGFGAEEVEELCFVSVGTGSSTVSRRRFLVFEKGLSGRNCLCKFWRLLSICFNRCSSAGFVLSPMSLGTVTWAEWSSAAR